KPGDRFVAIDDRVMPQMKRIDGPPEPTPAGMLDQRLPLLERPVIDRVQDFVECHRGSDRGETAEKPRKRWQQPLEQREERTQDEREHRERIPRKKRRLVLLGFDDREFVLDEKKSLAATVRLAGDARQRVMQRVLLVQV